MVTQIEIPPRVRPVGDSGYLEELTKAIFRSGFSWRVVREKWDAFRRAFGGVTLIGSTHDDAVVDCTVPLVGAYDPRVIRLHKGSGLFKFHTSTSGQARCDPTRQVLKHLSRKRGWRYHETWPPARLESTSGTTA